MTSRNTGYGPMGDRLTIPYLYYEVASASTPGAELFSEFMKEIGIDSPVKLVDGSLYLDQQQVR